MVGANVVGKAVVGATVVGAAELVVAALDVPVVSGAGDPAARSVDTSDPSDCPSTLSAVVHAEVARPSSRLTITTGRRTRAE